MPADASLLSIVCAGLNQGVELGAVAASRLHPCDVVAEYTGLVCTEDELSKCEQAWDHGDGRYAFMLPGVGSGRRGATSALVIEGGMRVEREPGDRSGYWIATCPAGTVNSPEGLKGSPEANVAFVNVSCSGFEHCGSQGLHFHCFLVAVENICATENLLVDYGPRYHNGMLEGAPDEIAAQRAAVKQSRKEERDAAAADEEDEDDDDWPIILTVDEDAAPAAPAPAPQPSAAPAVAVKHESSGQPPPRAAAVVVPPDDDSKRGDGSGSSGPEAEGPEHEPASAKRARLSPPLPTAPIPSQAEIALAAAEVAEAQKAVDIARAELVRLNDLMSQEHTLGASLPRHQARVLSRHP